MPSKIITLDPHEYGDARATRKVESVARRLRYRALGQECRTRGITNLLFAHHADDQAETTLMRLANNYLGTGLAGMRREARIPECEDMYGVHNSGTPRVLRRTKVRPVKTYIESGGILILRPLLDFTKDKLIATCEEASVRWVEDHTNKDRSLTLRNTVRYLHEADRLPVALRRPALCAIAAKVSDQASQLDARADEIFRSLDIAFYPRSGHAICKIDHKIASEINAMPDCDHVKAILLRKLLLLVSRADNIDLSTLVAASAGFMETKTQRAADIPSAPIAMAGATMVKLEVNDTEVVYELRRTLPPRNAKGSEVQIQLPLQPRENDLDNIVWSDWVLWDERYWIRIGGHALSDAHTLRVIVRILTPEDIKALRREDSKAGLDERLARIKGHLRTTLPVIEQILPDNRSRIVALPSLGWGRFAWFPVEGRNAHLTAQHYDIRYKHIDDSLTVPVEI